MQFTSWKLWAVGGVAALALMASSVPFVEGVSAAAPEPATVGQAEVQALQPVGFGRGGPQDRFGRFGDMDAEGQSLLAEALGISVEELEAAQEAAQAKAHEAALAQAVADGELTQEQADAIQALEVLWDGRGFGRGGRDPHLAFGMGRGVDIEDHDAYLAEALGISVDELEAAKDAAMQAGVEQAVADGTITQEQADRLLAGLALKDYLAQELDGVLEAAIEQAVADGVITQEQADELQDEWQGFGGRGMWDGYSGAMREDFGRGMRGGLSGGMRDDFGRGMRGGFPGGMRDDFGRGMRGGFPGGLWEQPDAPDTQSYETPLNAPSTSL